MIAIKFVVTASAVFMLSLSAATADESVSDKVLARLAELKKAKPTTARPVSPPFPFPASVAARYQKECADWLNLPVEWTHTTGIVFVLIPPGEFIMGSPADEPGHNSGGYDETQHRVVLTQPFYLSKHEISVGQFRGLVKETAYVTDVERKGGGNAHDERAVWKHRPGTHWQNPGYAAPFELKDHHPVVHVSHNDCQRFCHWLHSKFGLAVTLPGEAQWEWACRAGTASRYWWGSDEDTSGKTANVGDRSLKKTHPHWPRAIMAMDDGHAFLAPVGSYRPNPFGVQDMLGNVWEFCSTRYGPYGSKTVTDPGDLDPRRGFAVRGGGWSNIASDVRSASRNADPPDFGHSNLGFRIALPCY